jgi:broad specificity phosphatase PhoE
MTARWWWIRHAPVPDGGRIYGQRDVDCDCSDDAVFAALARALPRDAVWLTSHLTRTRQTAAAILARDPHRADAREPRALAELAEQHLGDWQGLDRAEFFAALGDARHPHWFANAATRAPNGESFAELFERVRGAVERLSVECAGRDIVAVAHGGTIRAAIGVAMGIEPEAALAYTIDNCSLTRIDRADGGWRIVEVNRRPGSVAAR